MGQAGAPSVNREVRKRVSVADFLNRAAAGTLDLVTFVLERPSDKRPPDRIVTYGWGARLSDAKLGVIRLVDGDLTGVNLSHAELVGLDGHGEPRPSELVNCRLVEADLTLAQLPGALLMSSQMDGASLVGANASGAHFNGASLRGTVAPGANLSNANFRCAVLDGADLTCANLEKANFEYASLVDVDLSDATLKDARGLSERQLSGARLTGASLPDYLARFDVLGAAAALASRAQTVFVSMLAASVYFLLTIFATKDLHLVTNSNTFALPIINTALPVRGFYFVAPWLLLALYGYLHIYLQRLWELLGTLPAYFPDGRALHERIHPWILNGWATLHLPLLRKKPPALHWLQGVLVVVAAWWIVPVAVTVSWARCLWAHDPWLSTNQSLVVALSLTGAVCLQGLAKLTLVGGRDLGRAPWWLARWWATSRRRSAGLLVATLTFLGTVCYGFVRGVEMPRRTTSVGPRPCALDNSAGFARRWVPVTLSTLGLGVGVALEEADLSSRPSSWLDSNPSTAVGARLSRLNLRYAALSNAFLANAELFQADLQGADLWRADLRNASLAQANLCGASLASARLEYADLRFARLDDAVLRGAQLQHLNQNVTFAHRTRRSPLALSPGEGGGAQLSLVNADLAGADLSHADLTGSDLKGADLSGVNLRGARLQDARNLSAIASIRCANLAGLEADGDFVARAKLELGALDIADDAQWRNEARSCLASLRR